MKTILWDGRYEGALDQSNQGRGNRDKGREDGLAFVVFQALQTRGPGAPRLFRSLQGVRITLRPAPGSTPAAAPESLPAPTATATRRPQRPVDPVPGAHSPATLAARCRDW